MGGGAALRDDAAPLRLLSVAPLHWSAGYDDLLLSLRQVLDGGVPAHLRVEADGPARERFVFTVEDLGLRDTVVLAVPGAPDPGGPVDALVLAAVEDRPWPELVAAAARADAVVATDLPWVRANLPPERRVLVPRRAPSRLAEALAERWAGVRP